MVRRTKQEAQQTRNALLDAAEAVFDARGVSGASLQEVAETAGVTRGAVYWHFRDKADLFNAMMDRAILPFERHWLVAGADDAADPLQRLRDLLFDILRQTAGDARLQRVLAISTQKVEYVGELDAIRQRHLRVCAQALQRFEALLRLAARRRAAGAWRGAEGRGPRAACAGGRPDRQLDARPRRLRPAPRGPQRRAAAAGRAQPRSNLNTATLARRFGQRRTTRPCCRPKLSLMCSPILRASSSKSACVPTRMLGVSYHW